MRRLLLAPVSTGTIVLGKAASAAAYGICTSMVLTLAFVGLLGMKITSPLVFALGLLFGAGTFALIGLTASVMVREVFEAMTLMNFFRFPLLFISGVFMPLSDLPAWLKPIAMLSPLTHVVEVLRYGVGGRCYFSSPAVPFLIVCLFFAACWGVSLPAFRRNANR